MKKHLYSVSVLLTGLFFLLATGQVSAQMLCQLTISSQPSPANPLSIGFGVTSVNDSICFGPQTAFTWSFGDGTSGVGRFPQHTYAQAGVYAVCVSAPTPFGTATACDSIQVGNGPAPCQSSLAFTGSRVLGTNLTYQFVNQSNLNNVCFGPNTVFTWTYHVGAVPVTSVGSAPITVTFPDYGVYTVCLSAASLGGDQFTSCASISVIPPFQPFNLGGMIKADGQCLQQPVLIELYGLNNNTYQSQTLSGVMDSCYYYFGITPTSNTPTEQYIIRATPLQGTSYIPTYYGDMLFWENATVIQPTQSIYDLHINLLQNIFDTIPGLGTVSGSVSGNGTTVNSTFNGNAISTTFELSKSRIIILNADNQPVGFAFINPNGTYSYPDLPDGQYKLRVESPKVPSQTVPFTINSTTPSAVINFNTTGSGVQTVTGVNRKVRQSEELAYPNPATETVSLSGVSGAIQIIDGQGRVVLTTTESRNISLKTLAPGLYTVRAQMADGTPVSARLVKK